MLGLYCCTNARVSRGMRDIIYRSVSLLANENGEKGNGRVIRIEENKTRLVVS